MADFSGIRKFKDERDYREHLIVQSELDKYLPGGKHFIDDALITNTLAAADAAPVDPVRIREIIARSEETCETLPVEDVAALKEPVKDLSKVYRDKDGKPRQNADGANMTIEEYMDSLEDGGFGFLIYQNNLTNVTKDFELHVPVTLRYGWGIIEKVITVQVYKTPESFQNR